MDKFMALKPRMSEKTYALSQVLNTYVFNVPKNANKSMIAAAVKAQFNVTVTNVNIANSIGKAKRTVRKGGRPISGKRASSKRAYVTLLSGESIPVFAAIEESEAKAEKIEKNVKKVVAKKEAK